MLAADYAGMAPALGLDPGMPDQAALIAAIRGKLERTDRWLLVFDNATEPGSLDAYLPRSGGGHVLITSRWQEWEGTADGARAGGAARGRGRGAAARGRRRRRGRARRGGGAGPGARPPAPGPGAGAGVHAGAQGGHRRLPAAARRGPAQGAGVAAAERGLPARGGPGLAGVARPRRPRLPGGGAS